MNSTVFPPSRHHAGHDRQRTLSPWRQRLRDSEHGVRQGLRGDSSFAVHFFTGTVIAAAAFVLDFAVIEWAVLILAFTMVFAAEMLLQILRKLGEHDGRPLSTRAQEAFRIGTAAVMVTIIGCLTVSGLLFARRLLAIWAD